MGLIVVKCNPCLAHLRGQVVAQGGREYRVDPSTLKLHLLTNGIAAPSPGCHPDDAQRLLSLPFCYSEVSAPPPPTPKKAKAVAKPKPKAVEADPEPVEATPALVPKADLSILDGSVSRLTRALETGKFDDVLDQLFDAEEAGKTRKSAVEAIHERMNQR